MPRITYGTLLCIDFFVCNFFIQGKSIRQNELGRMSKDLELNKHTFLTNFWKIELNQIVNSTDWTVKRSCLLFNLITVLCRFKQFKAIEPGLYQCYEIQITWFNKLNHETTLSTVRLFEQFDHSFVPVWAFEPRHGSIAGSMTSSVFKTLILSNA